MKRYFIEGKQVSEQKAKEIEKRNKEYMNSTDWSLIVKCQFIVVIND